MMQQTKGTLESVTSCLRSDFMRRTRRCFCLANNTRHASQPTWDHYSISNVDVHLHQCGFYMVQGTMYEICLRATFACQLARELWLTVWLFKPSVGCVFPAAAPGIALHKRTECFRECAGLTKTGLCLSRRSPNCSWLLNNVLSWKVLFKSVNVFALAPNNVVKHTLTNKMYIYFSIKRQKFD